MKNLIHRLIREEAGQDMVEYAFLIVFIAFAVIVAMGVLAGGIGGLFNRIGSTVNGVSTSTS